jgi:hypothetical protein
MCNLAALLTSGGALISKNVSDSRKGTILNSLKDKRNRIQSATKRTIEKNVLCFHNNRRERRIDANTPSCM